MRYVFQRSLIWDAANRVDENTKPVRIKAKSEERARRRLPDAGLGRTWILVAYLRTPQDPN
jgi:hypothetical protein